MECQQLHRDELAEKYLNGQLDPGAQDDFEVHILDCTHCLRQVEAVQTLRQELEQRAHQIRAYSQVQRSPFRWKWVTVAVFGLVICGLGLMEFRRIKAPQSAKLQTQPSVSAAPTTGSNETPAIKASQAPSSGGIDNRPVNGRNYIKFTLKDSQVSRDNAPSTGSAPTSGLNLNGQRVRSNLVSVDGADATDNSVNGIRTTDSQTAASGSLPTAPEKAQAPGVAGDETAKELLHLGTVQPAPYTFSGAASSSGHDAAMDPGALAGRSTESPTNQSRPFFREAMAAYLDQRYSDASHLLEQAAHAEPNAADVNFYLGVCRLLEGKSTDSIAPLEIVLKDEKSLWAQPAHFYLAKAYVQTGDLVRAESHLQAAAALSGRLKAEAGSELARLQSVRAKATQRNPEAPRP